MYRFAFRPALLSCLGLLQLISVGCATADAPSPAAATVSGTITYRERMALPPGAAVDVALLDVSRMDVAATVVAEQQITPAGQVPIPFSLTYDPARIDPRMSYVVRATIRLQEQLLFLTDRAYPVLTRGNADTVDLVLVRSGRTTEPAGQSHDGLVGVRWQLRSLGDDAPASAADANAPFLEFSTGEQGPRVSGNAGCNNFGGAWRVDGDALSLGPLISTRRACPDMHLEQRLLQSLEAVDGYRSDGSRLVLTGPDGVLASFEAAGPPR